MSISRTYLTNYKYVRSLFHINVKSRTRDYNEMLTRLRSNSGDETQKYRTCSCSKLKKKANHAAGPSPDFS